MTSPQPIVVVGAGTAGCTVVSYLASHTSLPIVVLEPGVFSERDDEPRFFDVLQSDLTSTDVGGYVHAVAVGGGSAVNGMLLTGEEPEHLRGLTRLATSEDIGIVGQALLDCGGRFSRLWWNGGRWNPGRAVKHLVEEGRVTILPHVATEVLHRDGHVWGVGSSNGPLSASIVVLCAGALVTPSLLLRSGLSGMNPMIGHGLQNHPTVTASFVHEPSEAVFDTAVVREWKTEGGAHMLNIAYERAGATDGKRGMLSVSLMNPKSRGHISLDQSGTVIVDFALLQDADDVNGMVEGLRDLMKLLRSGSFSNDRESIMIEGRSLIDLEDRTNDELRQWIRINAKGVSHASSSCAEVVDSFGRVKGLENCWIADASVLPSVPVCTPAAPVTMEALRIARNIGESLP